jgi:uncharacterized protein (TIGR00369 family)
MDKKNILKKINSANKDTLMETLDIEFIDIGEDFLVAKMPVTSKVYQPDGVLHGGATVALAESVGSAVSYMSVDYINQTVRGIIISANHLKSVKRRICLCKSNTSSQGKNNSAMGN